MRRVLLFAALLPGCHRPCEPPPADLAPMVDAQSPDDMTSAEAGQCVVCNPLQTSGGPCTPSRCAKSGDVYCCVF